MSFEKLIAPEPGSGDRRGQCLGPELIRRRTQNLIRKLATLANQFPEFRPLLEEPLIVLRHQSDRSRVLRAIYMGAWTIKDLLRETKLSHAEIRRVLDPLVAANIIFTSVKKEDTGPPTTLYLPAPNFQSEKK